MILIFELLKFYCTNKHQIYGRKKSNQRNGGFYQRIGEILTGLSFIHKPEYGN